MKQATTPASAKPSKAAAKPVATGGRAKGTRRRTVRQDGPDPIDVHVGARMHERRVMLGMSLTALAGKLGITFQQVQKYERGANRVSASCLFRAAQALDVPVSFFFDGYGDGAAPPHLDDQGDGRTVLALSRRIAALDPETRTRVAALVGAIAKVGA